jgi:hypothetical protein
MTLQPGVRLAIAPHFHMATDWAARLQVGTGVDEADGCFFPRPCWQALTSDDLSALVQVSQEAATAQALDTCLSIFQLPAHLRSEWWNLLEQAAGGISDGRLPGFESFVRQVGEFLDFKGLAVPEAARWDLMVSNPGQQFVRRNSEMNRAGGLSCSVAPWVPWHLAEEPRWPRLWGGINLGDEPTSVLLINLPLPRMEAMLRTQCPDQVPAETVGDLVSRFLRANPDCTTVRLILGPGEGYILPRGGLVLDGYLGSKQEPDVLLLISRADGQ